MRLFFQGGVTMRGASCLVAFLLAAGTGVAEKAKEPLPDYVGLFAEFDASIRAINDFDPACTNYMWWIHEAIDCKRKLRKWVEIAPWLEEVASTYTNNWKIQHATALGFQIDDKRWESIQCMDQAFRLAQAQDADGRAIGQLCLDYVDLLLAGRLETAYELQVKTPGTSESRYEADLDSLWNITVTNPAGEQIDCNLKDLPDWARGDWEWRERMRQYEPSYKRIFYDLPDSYESAENDGELVRWLIENRPSDGYGNNYFQNKWTMADFAVLIAGAHINLPRTWGSNLGRHGGVPPKEIRAILAALKDDETSIWGSDSVSNRIIQLPHDYCYIDDYIGRAEQGDRDAAETLGNIFITRCQLERAAYYFELAGKTNKVQSIRGNQGTFLKHSPYPDGTSSTVDYYYRNGKEVILEVYPIDIKTNLLERLISEDMLGSEVDLLRGEPETFQETTQTNQFVIADQPIKRWTHRLSPPPRHQDKVDAIHLPDLGAGNYLLRATIKDGNTVETVLHVYDTLLYSSDYNPIDKNGYRRGTRSLYFLCDALTGQPRPREDLHFFYLRGKAIRLGKEWVDCRYWVKRYKRGWTNEDGIYLSDEEEDRPTVLARLNQPLPFAVSGASAQLKLTDNYVYDYWSNESDLYGPTVFMTSDRPLYRPGDTGHIKLWVALDDLTYMPSVTLRKDKYEIPLIAETVDPYGDPCWDSYCGAEFSFIIPSNAPLGKYEYGFANGQKNSLRVEEYRAPEFDISADLTTNQTIEINASYMYGKPVPDGELKFNYSYIKKPQPDWHPDAPFDFLWGNGYWWNGAQFLDKPDEDRTEPQDCWKSVYTNLNAFGKFSHDLSVIEDAVEALAFPGCFNLYATVTDVTHKQFTKRIILPITFPERSLCCWMDKAFYARDEALVCHLAFENQTGPLHLKVCTLTNEVPVRTIPLTSETMVQLEPLPPGIYQASLMSNVYASKPFQFAVLGDTLTCPDKDQPVKLILEKGQYAAEETARLLVLVDQPGRYVYWFDRASDPKGLTIPPTVLYMDTTCKVVSLPLTWEEDKGIIKSAAMTIAEGKHHLASCTIPIMGSDLEAGTLELNTEKKTYSPGENVTLSFQSFDSKGKGVPSSITVTVYNRSLDLLANDVQTSNILKTLFGGWANHLNKIITLTDPHRTTIQTICPRWVMKLLMPQGSLPFLISLPDLDEITVFGSSTSIGGALAENLDSLDLGSKILPIREDFRDLAYWNATIETDSNGCSSVTFPIPDGLVEWKVKAWAMHTRYAASATTTLRCSKDFVIQLNLPRFMTEGDRLEISSSLRNHTTNTLNVTTTCSESGSVIQVESPSDIKLPEVMPDQQTLLYWNAHATSSGKSYITASAQSETCSDGMKNPIPVHPHGMLKRGGRGGVLSEKSTTQNVAIEIPQATAFDSVRLRLNCSPDMLDALIGALPFLAEYPHGCAEQTLNRFLPAVITLQTMDELGIDILTKTNALPADRVALWNRLAIIERAQDGIDRLEEAQHYKGTWGWNLGDGDSRSDYLTTAWALRGLYRASKVGGLDVRRDTIHNPMDSLLNYMEDWLNPEEEDSRKTVTDLDAMLGCVVSEIGINESFRYQKTKADDQAVLTKFLAYLLSRADKLSLYGKILLANAFDQQEDDASRDRIIKFVEQYLENDPDLGTYWLRTGNEGWWYWYNDAIELHAWYLKLLNRIEPNSAKTAGVARHLMQNRIYGDHWKSTRDTAICIEALCEFMVNNRPAVGSKVCRIFLNGESVPYSESGNYELSTLKPGHNELLLQASDGNLLFYDATWQYYTREDPITAENCELVTVSRAYYRIDPESDKPVDMPLGPTDTLKAGETVVVKLTFESSQTLEYLLAEDFKPAGFECLDNKSGHGYGKGMSYYQELHDERVSFYINRLRKGTSSISYQMRAEHAGTMSAMPATVELMYEPRQAANTDENKLRVVR